MSSSTPINTSSLLSTLLKSVSSLQSTRKVSVHVLQTDPRKTSSLYAHAVHHPRGTILQDVLVLLYIHLKPEDLYQPTAPTTESKDEAESNTSPSSTSPVLLVALEAQVYTLPVSPLVPTASTILYISKVDTSGYPIPSSLHLPYARTLLTSFLAHHLSLATRPTPAVWIHLFARAQPQYLFPDSGKDREDPDEKAKPLMSGAGLCRWWKGTMERSLEESGLKGDEEGLGLNVLIPGMSEYEAKPIMGGGLSSCAWKFSLLGLPSPIRDSTSTTPLPLSLRLPTFPDDPRQRFLVDLTTDTPSGPTPPPSKSSSSSGGGALERFNEARSAQSQQTRQHATDILGALEEEEFYERLAFRQECSLGDTVGFFCVSSKPTNPTSPPSTTTAEAGEATINKTLWSRLHATLLNQSFAKAEHVVKGSEVVWEAVRSLVGEEKLEAVEGAVEAVEEGEGKREERKRKVEVVEEAKPVVMLAVRKKKKVVE